jgi:hypothetical protein
MTVSTTASGPRRAGRRWLRRAALGALGALALAGAAHSGSAQAEEKVLRVAMTASDIPMPAVPVLVA